MTKRFLTPINLLTKDSNPVGVEGSIYYNNSEDVIKVYDGTNWNPVGTNVNNIIVSIDGGTASSVYYMDSIDGGSA